MKSAKWWMGLLAVAATMFLAVPGTRGEVTVTDVTARQRYPWNGIVDITCKVKGIEEGTEGLKFAVAAVDGESGNAQDVSHVRLLKDGAETDDLAVAANGSYALVWDARADLGEGQWNDMVVRVTVADSGPRGGQLWEGGPYWADRNVGAENPWDSGLYFWWGDTTGHRPSGTTFSFNFRSDNPAISTWWKDNATLQSEGWITAAGVLAPAHDAAHVHWGGAWRMPTDQEFSNLRDKCDWTWTTMSGVNGNLVRGRGAYAGNSIFLPAAGLGDGTSLGFVDDGFYWSSSVWGGKYEWDITESRSWELCISFWDHGVWEAYRHTGCSVRPVQGFTE